MFAEFFWPFPEAIPGVDSGAGSGGGVKGCRFMLPF